MWILLQPEQRVRNQERAHFVAAVVEDQRAPVAMLALARVGVLVERRAVEVGQPVRVLREVRRHPIDDHADARLVAAVDEVHEIVGRAEARGGREVADHLVAPRSGERMLHDGQQFDVRVAHLLHVLHQLDGQLAIGQRSVPCGPRSQRFQVHFVDRHRRFQQVGLRRAPPSTPRPATRTCVMSQTTRRRFRRQSRSRTRRDRPSAAGSRRSASGRCICTRRPRRARAEESPRRRRCAAAWDGGACPNR